MGVSFASSASLQQWLTLVKADGLGPIAIGKMIAHWGSPLAVFEAGPVAWRQMNVPGRAITALLHPPQQEIDMELEWAMHRNHAIVTWDDVRYPELLKHIPAPPPVLYIEGNVDCLDCPQIAVVGSRKASINGCEFATKLAYDLTHGGVTITSGMALGIDAAAHRGALAAGGSTVAVLGSGLQRIYPRQHNRLASQIIDNGALLSECALQASPKAYHFPRRNRIISGLSFGVVVVEATIKSGSLITVGHALDQGREVFAVPGSVLSPAARGCHELIKQGAKLVENHNDILLSLSLPANSKPQLASLGSTLLKEEESVQQALDSEQQKLLECVDYKLTTLDHIVRRIGWNVARVNSTLLMVELKGYITRVSGGYLRVK